VSPTEILTKARSLVAAGWAGPEDDLHSCWTISGAMCEANDEAVDRFSLSGALRYVSGRDDAGLLKAWDYIDRIVAPVEWAENQMVNAKADPRTLIALMRVPRGPSTLNWLMDPSRTTSEVLRTLDRAIQRSKGER
jgi:hypothetical protein